MAAGAPEPDATGAVHCSSPHTTSLPLSWPTYSRSAFSVAPVPAGKRKGVSVPITTRAALDTKTNTSFSAANSNSSRRKPYKEPEAPVIANVTRLTSVRIKALLLRQSSHDLAVHPAKTTIAHDHQMSARRQRHRSGNNII